MSKISVIIPTYNRPVSLKVAIESVLDQEITDLEIIVVDDHSEVHDLSAIREWEKFHKIHLIRNDRNLGVSVSRNRGLDQAVGEFVLFLDDDDILMPGMLKKCLAEIQKGNYDLVSCRSEVMGPHLSSGKLKRYNRQQTQQLNVYSMERHPVEHIFLYTPQIHTVVTRRRAIGQMRFPTELTYGEDMSFWLSLAETGLKCKKLDFVGCRYSIHGDSFSERVDYKSKIRFYIGLLAGPDRNAVIDNICYLKMTYLSLVQRDLDFFKWGLKALIHPILFIRHLRHFI